MKIESNDKNIQQLFTMGYLKIPRFQRAYSWEKAEVEDFGMTPSSAAKAITSSARSLSSSTAEKRFSESSMASSD